MGCDCPRLRGCRCPRGLHYHTQKRKSLSAVGIVEESGGVQFILPPLLDSLALIRLFHFSSAIRLNLEHQMFAFDTWPFLDSSALRIIRDTRVEENEKKNVCAKGGGGRTERGRGHA